MGESEDSDDNVRVCQVNTKPVALRWCMCISFDPTLAFTGFRSHREGGSLRDYHSEPGRHGHRHVDCSSNGHWHRGFNLNRRNCKHVNYVCASWCNRYGYRPPSERGARGRAAAGVGRDRARTCGALCERRGHEDGGGGLERREVGLGARSVGHACALCVYLCLYF